MNRLTTLVKIIIICAILTGCAAWLNATPEVVAELRLYEGFKENISTPAKVVTSYYLKPFDTQHVKTDAEIEVEKEKLKRVFSLKDIKVLTEAQLILGADSKNAPAKVIILNGRKLNVQLSILNEKENRFNVRVSQEGKTKALLETQVVLPALKTTVLGFNDPTGKTFFLSFFREKDGSFPAGPCTQLSDAQRPKLIKSVQPDYPEEALKKHVDGTVVLNAETDKYGRVKDLKVLNGHPLLRTAAMDAVKQWQYEPYIIDGKPKGVQFTVVIKFNLDKKGPGEKPIEIPSTQKPKLIKQVEPQYPKEALQKNIQGMVHVNAVTNEAGDVIAAHAVSGPKELRTAAEEAIKQWKYEPYILDGEKKGVQFSVSVRFNLDKKKPESGEPIHLPPHQKPRLIKQVKPEYPEVAKKAKVEGTVAITAVTDTYGRVVQAQVLTGHPLLRKPSLEALRQWEYEPYILDGKPKPVQFTVSIIFRLKEKQETNAIVLSHNERPKTVKQVPPKYPAEALKAGKQGNITVEVMVDKQGRVTNGEIIEGEPMLNNAALQALKQWIFEPTIRNGEPVVVRFTVVIKFNLK